MKKCIRLFVSFIGSLLALLMAHYFNICTYLEFIPDDKKYDVCISIYFVCAETIMGIFFDWVCKKIADSKTQVEASFFKPRDEANINTNPVVQFNELDMIEVNLRVKITGKSSNIENSSIKIDAIKQIDMQFAKKGMGSTINNNGDAIINFSDACEGHKQIDYEEEFKLVLQRGDYDTHSSIVIKPEIILNKSKRVDYKCNYIKIKLEER